MLTKAQKTNDPEASRALVWEIRRAAQFLFDLADRLRDQRSDHCAADTDAEWDLAVRDEVYTAWRDVEAYAAMRAAHGAETAEFVCELLDFMSRNRLLDD